MFSRYEFISKMAECFHYNHCSYSIKNEKRKSFYTIFMEESSFRNASCDITVFKMKDEIPELVLQFYQIKYDDIEETDKVMKRIEEEIQPREKTLNEIIEDFEKGKIDFKECNEQALQIKDR